ncbi:hypothetical protein P879_11874 [Paragonimus westermani]|uniref:Uncharacterized protein n=1 Tax=Paragonimus westermani TaxID=34504 RepID=A0A8T0D4X0_9TREM|nr:hypothetical protein P879_11874 [Paragonimus westermani]
MSVQRGKVKTVPRSRGQRVPVNSANFPKAIHVVSLRRVIWIGF